MKSIIAGMTIFLAAGMAQAKSPDAATPVATQTQARCSLNASQVLPTKVKMLFGLDQRAMACTFCNQSYECSDLGYPGGSCVNNCCTN